MNIRMQTSELKTALRNLLGIIPTRSIHPILSNVLLSAENGKLRISATNQDETLHIDLPCVVSESGALGVPLAKLEKLISTIDGQVFMTNEENRLVVKTDTGKFEIAGVDYNEFPEMNILDEVENTFEIDSYALRNIIDKVYFACSKDIARANFNGVFFEFGEGLKTVSTNGQILAKFECSNEGQGSMLIGRNSVNNLLKLSHMTNDVIFEVGTRAIRAKMANYTYEGKLVNEQFPCYAQVIPIDNDKTLKVNTLELKNALNRLMVMVNNDSNLIRFNIDKSLKINGKDYEVGTQGDEEIEIEYNGEPIEIGLSCKSILEIVSHIETERTVFTMKGNQSAITIKPENDDNYIVVIMPLRLAGEK